MNNNNSIQKLILLDGAISNMCFYNINDATKHLSNSNNNNNNNTDDNTNSNEKLNNSYHSYLSTSPTTSLSNTWTSVIGLSR